MDGQHYPDMGHHRQQAASLLPPSLVQDFEPRLEGQRAALSTVVDQFLRVMAPTIGHVDGHTWQNFLSWAFAHTDALTGIVIAQDISKAHDRLTYGVGDGRDLRTSAFTSHHVLQDTVPAYDKAKRRNNEAMLDRGSTDHADELNDADVQLVSDHAHQMVQNVAGSDTSQVETDDEDSVTEYNFQPNLGDIRVVTPDHRPYATRVSANVTPTAASSNTRPASRKSAPKVFAAYSVNVLFQLNMLDLVLQYRCVKHEPSDLVRWCQQRWHVLTRVSPVGDAPRLQSNAVYSNILFATLLRCLGMVELLSKLSGTEMVQISFLYAESNGNVQATSTARNFYDATCNHVNAAFGEYITQDSGDSKVPAPSSSTLVSPGVTSPPVTSSQPPSVNAAPLADVTASQPSSANTASSQQHLAAFSSIVTRVRSFLASQCDFVESLLVPIECDETTERLTQLGLLARIVALARKTLVDTESGFHAVVCFHPIAKTLLNNLFARPQTFVDGFPDLVHPPEDPTFADFVQARSDVLWFDADNLCLQYVAGRFEIVTSNGFEIVSSDVVNRPLDVPPIMSFTLDLGTCLKEFRKLVETSTGIRVPMSMVRYRARLTGGTKNKRKLRMTFAEVALADRTVPEYSLCAALIQRWGCATVAISTSVKLNPSDISSTQEQALTAALSSV